MRKKNKTTVVLTSVITIMIVLLIVFSYGMTKLLALPINLPFMKQDSLTSYDISAAEAITSTWYDTVIFEPKPIPEPEPVPEVEEPQLTTKFDAELDMDSLLNYIDGHVDIMENGEDFIFIDEVTVENRGTGIKTFTGHDVYAIAQADGIMIAGTVLDNGSRIKIAFMDKESKVDLDVVDDLTYWEEIEKSSNDANALLAINASDYTWNYAYDCGKLTGLVKRHGDLIRKQNEDSLAVGITKDKDLIIGNVEDIYTGIESTRVLAMNGNITFDVNSDDGSRSARTLIGQLKNGKIVFAIADQAGEGATITELLEEVNKYELDNAALLSGGDRTIMYWNGRIVNELKENDLDGLKLPTTWVVKSDYMDMTTTESDNTQVDEVALNLD